jgi:type I restriction enzyme S subunit
LEGYDCRLDCQPYLSGALETKIILEQLPLNKEPLSALTAGYNGGIFNGPKFARTYVDSAEYGVPFVGSSSMLAADLSDLPLLSRRQAEDRKLAYLQLQRGMSLISCSGTIGRMVYARPEMEGMWSSQHVMKVVPDPARVPSGYLYACLNSEFGSPLVVSGTYGSIIPEIGPHHIADLPVPRLGDALEQRIHVLVEEAAELRTEANREIGAVTAELTGLLGFRPLTHSQVRGFGTSIVWSPDLRNRLDATYYSQIALEADRAVQQAPVPKRLLSEVTKRLFKPPIFKRLWVGDDVSGVQFVSGNDAYKFQADEVRHVSRSTPGVREFILQRGWVIFQAAGQTYGLFGKPLLVNGWLENLFCADDMYRIVPHSEDDGAYLFVFFRTEVGQVLIKRQSAGDSIPRVWDPQMNQVIIPWPNTRKRGQIATAVLTAHERRWKALCLERDAITLVERALADAAANRGGLPLFRIAGHLPRRLRRGC